MVNAGFSDGCTAKVGDRTKLLFRDPDNPWRTGTAIPALRAMKTESLIIPGSGFGHVTDFHF